MADFLAGKVIGRGGRTAMAKLENKDASQIQILSHCQSAYASLESPSKPKVQNHDEVKNNKQSAANICLKVLIQANFEVTDLKMSPF